MKKIFIQLKSKSTKYRTDDVAYLIILKWISKWGIKIVLHARTEIYDIVHNIWCYNYKCQHLVWIVLKVIWYNIGVTPYK